MTLNFAQEDLVVLISEVDVLLVGEGEKNGIKPTEGYFICLGLKHSVFLLLKGLSRPPISARPAFFFLLLKVFENCTFVVQAIIGQLCKGLYVRILSMVLL